MTIKSLQDLNTYAQTPITYNDVRTAQVLFDRGATVDQTLTISENSEFVLPWGINIDDITQYDVADVEYHIDLTSWSDPVSISWDYLPPHIVVTRGSGNDWIVSEIRSRQDWLYVRQVKVLPPFGFSGFVQHNASIQYYSDNQDSSRDIVGWDIDLTVTQVEYFASTVDRTYVSNTLYSNFNPTSILTDPNDFDPVWDLRIYADDTGAIEEMFSDGSAAEAAWNDTTKQYVITGDTESINEVLASLDLETNRFAADFVLYFKLANNYTSNIEYQVQQFFSRDFISDQTVVAEQSCDNNYIRGFVADPFPVETVFADVTQTPLIRDPNPTEITSTTGFSCEVTRIRDFATEDMNAEFACTPLIILIDCDAQFTMDVRPIVRFWVDAEPGDIHDNQILSEITSTSFRMFDLGTRALTGPTFSDSTGTATFGAWYYGAARVGDDYVVIGDDGDNSGYGTAYLFNKVSGAKWEIANPDIYPAPSNPTSAQFSDGYGRCVDVSDSYVIVGAPNESAASAGDDESEGAVYIWNPTTVTVRHSIANPDPDDGDFPEVSDTFGRSVAISDSYALVGAPRGKCANGKWNGRVHVYNPNTGALLRTIDSPSTGTNVEFGTGVAVSGNYGLIIDEGTYYPTLYCYDLTTGTQVWSWQFTGTVANVWPTTIAANSRSVAVFGPSSDVYVFDVETGQQREVLDASDFTEVSSFRNSAVFMSDDYLIIPAYILGQSGTKSSVFGLL